MSIFICAVVVICTLLYWLLGSSSVELYGNKKVQGNILLNLKSDPRMELPVLAVFLTVVLSFPLLFHPLRDLCDDSHTFNNGETSLLTRAKIASLLLLSQLMLAVWIPGVQVVFAFTGASSCLVIGVMFPAIFYTKICPWRKTAHGIALFCSLWTIMIFYSIVSFDAIRFLTFSTFSTWKSEAISKCPIQMYVILLGQIDWYAIISHNGTMASLFQPIIIDRNTVLFECNNVQNIG